MFSERTGVEVNPPAQRCGLTLLFLYTRPKREEKKNLLLRRKLESIHISEGSWPDLCWISSQYLLEQIK